MTLTFVGFIWCGCGKTTGNNTGTDGVAGASTSGAAGAANRHSWTPMSVDRVDILFVVDNSAGMEVKQDLLANAIPSLLSGLTRHRCMSLSDPSADVLVSDDAACPAGYTAAGRPLRDIHVGVITSSLGAYGGDFCSERGAALHGNDHAYLLPFVRSDLDSWNGAGFLAWDPSSVASDGVGVLSESFRDHVEAAGTSGCGFEATLEAWYRFLVNPRPVEVVDVSNGDLVLSDVDEKLLNQRSKFLRPDSLLTVFMLSDENDCSVRALGDGYRVTSLAPLPHATGACDEDPNSDCCFACDTVAVPPGCVEPRDDPACIQAEDPPVNLRCWQQKRRFGKDFLHPISRYVAALRNSLIQEDCDSEPCATHPNPIYAAPDGLAPRPHRVVVGGILGVPWQDLATDATLDEGGLRYRRAQDLDWLPLVGDPSLRRWPAPEDPFLLESVEPRQGTHPRTGESMAPPDSMDPRENSINGHERPATLGTDDLQAACLFPLPEPVDCADVAGCPCTEQSLVGNDPRCQPPGGGSPGLTQYFADAKPSLRQLGLLHLVSEDAVVASACPKAEDLGGGNVPVDYEPAMSALLREIASHLNGPCSGKREVGADGQVACLVVEATPDLSGCGAEGRTPVSTELAAEILKVLAAARHCDTPETQACESFSVCGVEQLRGEAMERCQTDAEPGVSGFCYVEYGPYTSHCPEAVRYTLRLVGPLHRNARVFYSCE